MANAPKPPYTSVSDVDAFFERVARIAEPKPPKKVDSPWVETYGFETAHSSAIPSMLRWLGVIDDEGKSTGVWDEIRVENTRKTTLDRLVRQAYAAVCDAIDVGTASNSDLRGSFIQAYSIGDPRRHITCFLALCQHAGIKTGVPGPATREATVNGAKSQAKTPTQRSTKGAQREQKARGESEQRRDRVVHNSGAVSISLNVEIPAEWTDEEIRARIAAVTRAVDRAGQGDS